MSTEIETKDNSTKKIDMWERKLLDLGLRNTLINMKLGKKIIPLFVDSISDLEDAVLSGQDFVLKPRNEDKEEKKELEENKVEETQTATEPEDSEKISAEPETEQESKPVSIPAKEYTFEDLHQIDEFREEITKRYAKNQIMTAITKADLETREKEIFRAAKSSLDENGANTLYMALGILKWFEQDKKDTPRYAPLIMVPIDLVRKSLALGYVVRAREEETILNISILEKLRLDYGIKVDGLDPLPVDGSGVDVKKVFDIIKEAIAGNDGWDVYESAYIGIFSFSQFVMWNDLKSRRDELYANNTVKSLIEGKLTWDCKAMDPSGKLEEGDTLLPLQADASQLYAIKCAVNGDSFVLHGPPGTGKSQTITSMIANSIANGKTVLFAAEKKAALEVVYNRLEKIGISPFCLEVHSNKARKRDVLDQLKRVLDIKARGNSDDFNRKKEEISARKKELDSYAEELHKSRECGWTLYELVNIYESSSSAPDIGGFSEEFRSSFNNIKAENIESELQQLASVGIEMKRSDAGNLKAVTTSEWSQSLKTSVPESANAHIKSIDDLASHANTSDLNAIREKVQKAREALEVDRMKDEILKTWDKDFLDEDGKALLKEYKIAQEKWAVTKTFAVNAVYKKVSVYDKNKNSKDKLGTHFEMLRDFQEKRAEYKDLSDPDLVRLYDAYVNSGNALSALIGKLPENCSSLDGEKELCTSLTSDLDGLKDRIQYNRQAQIIRNAGAGNVIDAYETGIVDEDSIVSSFRKAYSKTLADSIIDTVQVLNEFSGSSFGGKIEQFKKLYKEYTDLTKQEIYLNLAGNIPDLNDAAKTGTELATLQKAISSGGRGVSIRKLFEQIPNLLIRLCPCMLMSPMSVAQYLGPDSIHFDMVVFDEASQLPTCKAVGVLARGDSAVIVGDPKQMPPTSFFMSEQLDEENIEDEDLESILDDCLAINMPQTHLLWHYRSRHESLINFSNKAFYENRLYTFPSSNDRKSKVKFEFVEGVFDRGGKRTNEAEANEVIKDIERRFNDEDLRKQSIGVVTFNINQQSLIEDKLEELCKKNPELEEWVYSSEEAIFVKNLENVQGDERDVILFSIGYGTDENGSVYMNFGPLNRDGGWRRLNVAVTRSRCEMRVFSSMTPEMIRLTEQSSQGVVALKRFLEYANGNTSWENGLEETYASDSSNSFSPIINRDAKYTGVAEKICEKLREKGYTCERDIGKSGYKIDIGIADPGNDEEYILGILLDGPNYRDSQTTRDRELAQISVLEGLGWKITRVWTVDWWENPDKVIGNIVSILEEKEPEPVPEAEEIVTADPSETEEISVNEKSGIESESEDEAQKKTLN